MNEHLAIEESPCCSLNSCCGPTSGLLVGQNSSKHCLLSCLSLLPEVYGTLHPQCHHNTPTVRAAFKAAVPTLDGQDNLDPAYTPTLSGRHPDHLRQMQAALRERDRGTHSIAISLCSSQPSVPAGHVTYRSCDSSLL